jgi:hypothetical protein
VTYKIILFTKVKGVIIYLTLHGETDDDGVDWSDFKKSQAFKTADDEIQEWCRS